MSSQPAVHPPGYVVWEITLRCNLACGHCGSRAGSPRRDELSTEEALDLIDQMAALGIQEVTLIGGEAFLRPDWLTLAAAITAHGIKCTMTTGGYGISDRIAAKMAAAGIRTVSVSVDGLQETHDRLRGRPGSWQQCLKTIARLRAAGIEIGVNTQLNRRTAPEIPLLYERLREAGIQGWQIQLTVPMGNAADNADILFQPDELLELYPMLGELAQWAKEDGISLQAGNNVGYYGPYGRLLRGRVDEQLLWTGCDAGVSVLGLEADGTIKGCPSLPTGPYTGGNIRDTPLAEVVYGAPQLRFNEQRRTDHLWGFCRGCDFAELCRGGCSWTAHVFFDQRGNNPYCHHRALTQAARGVRERLQPTRPAPGRPFDNGRFSLREIPYAENAPAGFSLKQVRWPARWLEIEPALTDALEQERDRSVAAYQQTALATIREKHARAHRLHQTGEVEEAERLYREALPLLEAALGDDAEVAELNHRLAVLLLVAFRTEEAEPFIDRAVSLGRALYGEHHHQTLKFLNNTAVLEKARKRYSAAADRYQDLIALVEEMEGPDSNLLPPLLSQLVAMLHHTDRHEEGYAAALRGRALAEHHQGDDARLVATFSSYLPRFSQRGAVRN